MKPTECACCSRIYNTPEDYLKGTTKFRMCSQRHLWFECSCGSGIMLRKGEYEWYSPTLKMSESAATLFQSIKDINHIPLIPSTIIQIQAIIADANSSVQDVHTALKRAPNLALSIIKSANQLRRSTDIEIKDLEEAITAVGRKTISELILTDTLQGFDFKTKVFRKDIYWKEALLIGQIAEYLTEHFAPHLSKDEAYIAGSLLNIGKVVGAICFPQKTDEVAKLTQNPRRKMTWAAAEDYLRALSHVNLGEVASALWGFPDYVTHTMASHHLMPDEVPDFSEEDVLFMDEDELISDNDSDITLQQLVATANQLAHIVLHQPSRFDNQLCDAYCQVLGISKKDRDEVIDLLLQNYQAKAS
ncbi:MAG: HDOD domain-containing protein [Oligoflexus sp.]